MAAVLKPLPKTVDPDRFDQAAICMSVACLFHCLAVPLLLIAAPWLSLGFLGEEWFHLSLIALVVPLSLIAFHLGFRLHGSRRMLAPGLVGLGLIVLAAVFEILHVVDHLIAAGLTSAGGVLLIIGHWRNLRARRCTVRPVLPGA